MKHRKRFSHLQDELEQWPGVTLRPLRQRNHMTIGIQFRNQERKMTLAVSASDHRANLNEITCLRRICRELGAEKTDAAD